MATRPIMSAAIALCRSAAAAGLCILLASPALADNATHVVQSGEMLGSIAAQHGVTVSELREWNDLSGDIIYAGQELRVFPEARIYAVEPGDTAIGIASAHEVSVADLVEWNPGLDPDRIRVGQELRLLSASSSSSSSSRSGGASRTTRYEVRPGDIAGSIAAQHDVTVADLVAWNPGLDPNRIRVGQELTIRQAGRVTRNVTYTVQSGDFVGRIAERYGVTIADLVAWNPGMDPDRIRVGDELRMVLRGPEVPSESIGRANSGRLINGEQLPPHRAYTIRDLNRAWGTNETIGAIVEVFDHMRRRFDSLPRVAVHDLSAREGGEISDHRSHQSGRDADIGYYQIGCRRDCAYRRFDPEELDVERQWAMLEFWIERDLVDYVFVDYAYQEVLYEWLQDRGATRSDLREWFQYPRGRDVAAGIIRHEPNHADHLHVRFACDPTDEGCR